MKLEMDGRLETGCTYELEGDNSNLCKNTALIYFSLINSV